MQIYIRKASAVLPKSLNSFPKSLSGFIEALKRYFQGNTPAFPTGNLLHRKR